MSQYTPEYYAAKTEKYKALHATSESSFDAKLAKKQAHLQFWRANYQLWSYRGCMTRDVIPDDCDEAACEQRVFATFRKYNCKVQLMNTVVRGWACTLPYTGENEIWKLKRVNAWGP